MSFRLLQIVYISLIVSCSVVAAAKYDDLVHSLEHYSLPDLPYSNKALQPFLDAATLTVHHQGHHRIYTDKLNAVLTQWRQQEPSSTTSRRSIVDMLQHLEEVPKQWRTAVKNNGGGYVNHVLYWATMCPAPAAPVGDLARELTSSFGSVDAFKEQFTDNATTLFGSGYVWLCARDDGTLVIATTSNQDSPLSDGLWPILVLDVWEHAYYLTYQFKRATYIEHWWEVVCWSEVNNLRLFWKNRSSRNGNHTEL